MTEIADPNINAAIDSPEMFQKCSLRDVPKELERLDRNSCHTEMSWQQISSKQNLDVFWFLLKPKINAFVLPIFIRKNIEIFAQYWHILKTFANNLDPDEALQSVRLHLRSKLFDTDRIYVGKIWMETMNICSF